MTHSISDILLSQLSEFVATETGLHFPRERWHDLERGIRSATQEFGFKDAVSCIPWLVSSRLTKKQIEILASHLTIGETYFFREKRSFEILEEHILPELIRSRRGVEERLRIWCAACSTGEEPYSIAILLNKMIPDLKDWNITILATDINPRFLQKATEGVYTEWSFRGNPPWIKERYFKKAKDSGFETLSHIKKIVTFSYLNLAEDTYPSLLNNTNAMDIIFCRNVLMYFAPECTKKVIQNLYHSIVDGGWMIVSPSEVSHVLFSQFMTVNFHGAILYKKDRLKPETVDGFSYRLDMETKVTFHPSSDFLAQPEPKVTSPQESKEPLSIKVKGQKTAEPRPTPYIEALALYEQSRYSEAEGKIIEFLSQNDDDAKPMALLARVYANQGKLAKALEWCEKAIAIDKLNPLYHYLLATILQERGKAEEAVISLKRAIYLDQNFVLAHFALGNLALRQGKFKESNKYFENALSLLSACRREDVLPESEGITAGRLMEIIQSIT